MSVKVLGSEVQGFKGYSLDSAKLIAGWLLVSGCRRGLPYAPVASVI